MSSHAVVITVSDRVSAGQAEDRSGPAAAAALRALGIKPVTVTVVPDGVESVEAALIEALDADPALIVTTGGTGFTPRDVTPEATSLVIDRPAPGLSEAIRAVTFGQNPYGMLSRGVSGIARRTLIVNVPGSVSGVEESLAAISEALPHALQMLRSAATDHQ